ncbi:MAG: F0F1 ATP synthase subunit delta [Bifidobacteriaceae bacterium]|jgi:F-type H+-transporting ATPase subunit delta|nr:F0F1 ATP synthase subunit delta [Bifidobacteriaceae bacterium]
MPTPGASGGATPGATPGATLAGRAMLGGSAASLAQAKAELGRRLAGQAATAAPAQIAAELFALTDALDADPALARALTNPNRPAGAKHRLVQTAMAGHFEPAVELAAWTAARRWSKDGDLADALELMAFDAQLAAAEAARVLAQVEAELFDVDAVLLDNRELRTALGDLTAAPALRLRLVGEVFGSAVRAETLALLERVVAHPRGRGVRHSLQYVGDLVAARRRRLVVNVTSAVALTDGQAGALAEHLAKRYGRAVQLNVTIDRSVIGGVRVRVGDQVVDGSLATRFTELRRDLAA